jgi:hypothetical protein
MGEHEHRVVERRILAPPARPRVTAPGPPDRAEHAAPHDGGTDARIALGDELIVKTTLASLRAMGPAEGSGCEQPLVQSGSTLPERIVQALVGPGGIPVE